MNGSSKLTVRSSLYIIELMLLCQHLETANVALWWTSFCWIYLLFISILNYFKKNYWFFYQLPVNISKSSCKKHACQISISQTSMLLFDKKSGVVLTQFSLTLHCNKKSARDRARQMREKFSNGPGPTNERWIFQRAGKLEVIFSNGPGRQKRNEFSNGPVRAI